jgi:hypothetical protein
LKKIKVLLARGHKVIRAGPPRLPVSGAET